MKATTSNVAAMIITLQLMNASTVSADEEKVPENVTHEVVEAEKRQQEQEETEEGEASGNVEDCEHLDESGDSQDEVEKKNLDECVAMVK